MAIVSLNYTRKDPDIKIHKVMDLEEMAQFLVVRMPSDSVVTTSSMGTLSFQQPGGSLHMVYPGGLIGEDSKGNFFRVPQEILDCLFDPS